MCLLNTLLPKAALPVTELTTITLMVDGSVADGLELPPVSLVHVPPQFAGPLLNLFNFAHLPPQNVTCCPTTALSP
jgi:hypothetical protein